MDPENSIRAALLATFRFLLFLEINIQRAGWTLPVKQFVIFQGVFEHLPPLDLHMIYTVILQKWVQLQKYLVATTNI